MKTVATLSLAVVTFSDPKLGPLANNGGLTHWTPVATNQIGSDGMVVFHDACASGGACRFYRLVMP